MKQIIHSFVLVIFLGVMIIGCATAPKHPSLQQADLPDYSIVVVMLDAVYDPGCRSTLVSNAPSFSPAPIIGGSAQFKIQNSRG